MKAVILAAGQGTRLRPLTDTVPKCLVPVGGTPLLDRMIARVADAGIDDVIVVSGYLHDVLAAHLAAAEHPVARAATVIFNDHYADWGNFYSLLVAEDAVGDAGFVKIDGDVLVDDAVFPALLAAPGPGVLAVDRSEALAEEEMKVRVAPDSGRALALNKRMDPAAAYGESIGIERVDPSLAPTVFAVLREMIDRGETDEYYERGYELLMERGETFHCADISGCTWHEIDTPEDLERAGADV